MNVSTKFSLALNALLAGLVVWLAFATSPPGRNAGGSRFLTNRVLRLQPQPAAPLTHESAPEVLEINEPFHWAQLESADYRVYVANLRAVGCPEPTVRDIVIADVNELFHPRVKALVDEVSGQFWSLILRRDDFEKMVDEKHDQLRALDDERDEIFTALFGDHDPRGEEQQRAAELAQRGHWERLVDFLPDEKRSRFVTANVERERLWNEFLRTPGLTGAQHQAKRRELDAAHDAALGEWLTPGELDELKLRQSGAANLRHRLAGVDLSEDEMRLAAKIQLAKDNAKAEKREVQLSGTEVAFQELLGPERYTAFQRALDNRFAPIRRVVQRLELADAVAAQAYGIRKQAEDAAKRVRANPAIAAEERQAMLQAIGAETKQGLAGTLGTKGFATYEKIDGAWLQQLTTVRP